MINLNGALIETIEQLEEELIRQEIPENLRQGVRNSFLKIYPIESEEASTGE